MKLQIDINNPAHVKAAAAFFNELASQPDDPGQKASQPDDPGQRAEIPSVMEKLSTGEEVVVEEKPKRKRRTKREIEEEKAKNAKPEPSTDDKADSGEIDRNTIRGLVGSLTSDPDNKSEIKAKLKEYGSHNVGNLDEEHFEGFHEFLLSLS